MPERQKAKRTKSSKKMVVGGTAIAGRDGGDAGRGDGDPEDAG